MLLEMFICPKPEKVIHMPRRFKKAIYRSWKMEQIPDIIYFLFNGRLFKTTDDEEQNILELLQQVNKI